MNYKDAFKLQKQKLDKIIDNAQKLDGQQISLPELLSDTFIQQHTNFDGLQQFVDAGGVNVEEDLASEAWDAFVVNHSNFSGWEDMLQFAVAEWAKQKLLR